ncbi:methanobactin export MATE transporter MbnM [Hyalangium rubrum]|uniref:Di-heme enzyme n=1 Tax=Hyalangium rubrum TaxID=3103134 RepID=A0ABU5H414_9BACT|nr:methanobactin export MATE transporter MbnM [Hyalangium sp. s54d21]MDY7227532.1 di-heme enzyme [Hyalangium sp. s54d21]
MRRGVLQAWCAGWLLLLCAACGDSGPEPYVWNLPPGFPEPAVPEDNPMSTAKVELGRHLFYDTRLSANGTQSCASCHRQDKAFTDTLPTAVGSTGEHHRRNSMSLGNVAYAASLTWANPVVPDLEAQALVPLFGEHPVELGLAGQEEVLLQRLAEDAHYPKRFAEAFPEEKQPLTMASVVRALASFERTLLSGGSPYDRYTYRDELEALSLSAKRGMTLFFSERLECFHCHQGFAFTDSVKHKLTAFPEVTFHNTNLYNVDGRGTYPATDEGLKEFTGKPEDTGRYRSPTLRNIALTAPYMHDGSIATLSEVLDHYAAGGRASAQGSAPSPYQSEFVRGFTLTPQEREDVLAFLESLTDTEFLTDPRFSDPFATAP